MTVWCYSKGPRAQWRTLESRKNMTFTWFSDAPQKEGPSLAQPSPASQYITKPSLNPPSEDEKSRPLGRPHDFIGRQSRCFKGLSICNKTEFLGMSRDTEGLDGKASNTWNDSPNNTQRWKIQSCSSTWRCRWQKVLGASGKQWGLEKNTNINEPDLFWFSMHYINCFHQIFVSFIYILWIQDLIFVTNFMILGHFCLTSRRFRVLLIKYMNYLTLYWNWIYEMILCKLTNEFILIIYIYILKP